MSSIEYYREDGKLCQREIWDSHDIAEHLGISYEKADRLHMIANKAKGVIGYGDISKDDFIEFLEELDSYDESKRLQDEANAAVIIKAKKNFNLSLGSQLIYQALSLLKGLG